MKFGIDPAAHDWGIFKRRFWGDYIRRLQLELREHAAGIFSLTCRARHPGFGHVIVGLLRALADDYGALVLLEHRGGRAGHEIITIKLLSIAHASGRRFDLGARAS
ncbi:hypothetical protein [Roseovarius sp. ZX-A-9]|uniref:hypothetical protein n=1 Tax=Roseovarius sp. ZX-A-9 TaxID=3014783 RepID=UPI00232D395F|nr:hypothetical protein [Roseovarius sp. ZX-A-9]